MTVSAFVSGAMSDIDEVRSIMALFDELDITLTHDWTTSDGTLRGTGMLDHPEEAGVRAHADITGVVNAYIYVITTNNERAGKGMYAELGAALALNQVIGWPAIFLVGALKNPSIFYMHPAVHHVEDVDALRPVLEQAVESVKIYKGER